MHHLDQMSYALNTKGPVHKTISLLSLSYQHLCGLHLSGYRNGVDDTQIETAHLRMEYGCARGAEKVENVQVWLEILLIFHKVKKKSHFSVQFFLEMLKNDRKLR